MTQNSSSPRDYNFQALRGAAISDQEYVETFGIPEEYAHTPKMIEWHVKDLRDSNRRVYEERGMDPAEIESTLKKQETTARSEYKRLLAMNGLL